MDYTQYQGTFSPYSSAFMKEQEELKALREENKRLKEAQMQMSDPLYVEFQNTPEYQNAKKDNVLTFLFASVFPQWQASELGQQFIEWDKKQFEIYKQNRLAKINQQSVPPVAPKAAKQAAPPQE